MKKKKLKPEDWLLLLSMLLIGCNTFDINKHLGLYVIAVELLAIALLLAHGRGHK